MNKAWFYDLPRAPSPSFLAEILSSISPDLTIVGQHIHANSANLEDYCSVELKTGFDRICIVVGMERTVADLEETEQWWVSVCCSPWWRHWWNTLPEQVIPIVEMALNRESEDDLNTVRGVKGVSDGLELVQNEVEENSSL